MFEIPNSTLDFCFVLFCLFVFLTAGLRSGRPGGGAGALGSAGGALGGRAHSGPWSSQPYGDDPHGGAAVERGPGTAPPLL